MSESTELAPAELLRRWRAGDSDALHRLLPLVYEELRRVARHHLRGEHAAATLETTALINEAYLRLVEQPAKDLQNRCHFVAVASHLMRQILVDHARERLALKRQGGYRVTLSEDMAVAQPLDVDLLAIEDALVRLAQLDAQQARVVELRYFGGLSIAETAAVLGVSEATVKRDWATARAWLHREVQQARTGEQR
ncbi:MAG TPA: ECF-type sigma factor [Steroidobacteraceae bacterium]|nr:ECF-type sigma factor [Steroidobacteraceae bacterium]